jgi:hypothetical protein
MFIGCRVGVGLGVAVAVAVGVEVGAAVAEATGASAAGVVWADPAIAEVEAGVSPAKSAWPD